MAVFRKLEKKYTLCGLCGTVRCVSPTWTGSITQEPGPCVRQEKAGYASELEALIEQMEGLVGEKAALEAERAGLAQQAGELQEQWRAAQVRGPRLGMILLAGGGACPGMAFHARFRVGLG